MYKFIATKLCGDLEKTVAQRDVKTMDEPADVKEEHLKVDYMVEIGEIFTLLKVVLGIGLELIFTSPNISIFRR